MGRLRCGSDSRACRIASIVSADQSVPGAGYVSRETWPVVGGEHPASARESAPTLAFRCMRQPGRGGAHALSALAGDGGGSRGLRGRWHRSLGRISTGGDGFLHDSLKPGANVSVTTPLEEADPAVLAPHQLSRPLADTRVAPVDRSLPVRRTSTLRTASLPRSVGARSWTPDLSAPTAGSRKRTMLTNPSMR